MSYSNLGMGGRIVRPEEVRNRTVPEIAARAVILDMVRLTLQDRSRKSSCAQAPGQRAHQQGPLIKSIRAYGCSYGTKQSATARSERRRNESPATAREFESVYKVVVEF